MRKLIEWLKRQSEFRAVAFGFVLVWLVAAADMVSYSRVSYTLFYLAIIAGAAWVRGKRVGILLALASTFLMLNEEWIRTQTSRQLWILWWNTGIRLGMFLSTAVVVARLRSLTTSLEQQVALRTARLEAEIAEHKTTEAQLRESLLQFRQVTENISEVFWMSDPAKHHVLYISPGYERIWGRTCDSLYASPRSWLADIHPADRDRVLQAAATKQVLGQYDEEYRIMRPDGAERWIHDRAFPVRDRAGEVYRIAGIAEDITQRKQAEAQLRGSEQRLRMALEAADMITWELDIPAGTIHYSANISEFARGGAIEPYCSVSGLLHEVHPDERSALSQAIQRTATEGCAFEREYRVRLLDGNYRWILSKGKILGTEEGKSIRVVGVSQDITPRKEVEQRLREFTQILEQRVRERTAELEVMNAALRESERRARAILEANTEAILLLDREGKMLLANSEVARRLGRSLEEMIGKDTFSFLPPSLVQSRKAHFAEAIQSGRPVRWEDERGGIWYDNQIYPVRGEDGAIVGVAIFGADVTKRKMAEEALRKSNAMLKAINDGTTNLICMKDLQGRIVTLNPAMAGFLGKSEAELIGQDDLDSLPNAEEAALIREHDRRIIETGCTETVEEAVKVGGRQWHCLFTKSPYRDADGSTIGVIGIGTDITARKAAEEALAESQRRSQGILNATTFPIFLLDLQGNIIEANVAAARQVGRTLENLAGVNVFSLLPAEIGQRRREQMEIAIQSRQLWHFEDQRADREFDTYFYPVADARGEITQVAVFVVELTERKRAEAALREREAQLRLALEASNAGVWSWEVAANRASWDDQYHQLYGFEPDEPRSHEAWLSRVHPEDRDALVGAIKQLMNPDAGDDWNREFRVLHPVKGTRWMLGLGRVQRDQEGRAVRFAGINLDITKNKEAEEEIRRLNATLEQRVQERTAELAAANAALQESQELLRAFFDNPAALCGVVQLREDDLLVVSANAPQAAAYGRTPAQMGGVLASELGVPRSIIDLWRSKIQEAARRNMPVSFEYSSDFRKPGSWGMSTVTRLHLTRQGLPLFAYIAFDISARKQAEEQQQRLTAILEASPAFVGYADAKSHRILYVNRNGRRMCGLREDEDVTRLIISDVHPAWANGMFEEVILPSACRDGHWTGECAFLDRDGREIPVLMVLQAHKSSDGEVESFSTVSHDITERKQTEEALRISETRLRLAAEAAQMGVWERDLKIDRLYWSPAIEQFCGYEKGTFPGTTEAFLELLHPDSLAVYTAGQQRVRTGDGVVHEELHLRLRDGRERWCLVRGQLVRDQQGEPERIVGVAFDITERKQAEQALRESESRFRAVFESSSDCILVWDRHYNYLYANQAAIDHVGTTQDKVIGKNIRDGLGHVPDFMKLWMSRVDRAFATGESFRVEDAVSVGSRLVHSESQISPIRDTAGQVFAVGVVYRDVTQRKQAEEALKASELRNRMVLETAMDGFWMTDLGGKIIEVNQAYCRMTGYSREELLRMHIPDLEVNEPKAEDVRKHIAHIKKSGMDRFETRHRCKNGHMVDVEVSVTYLPLETERTCAFIHDITERKRIEEALQLQARVLESMVEGVQLVDEQGIICLTNPALDAMFGYPHGALIGKHVSLLSALPPKEYSAVLQGIVENIYDGGTHVGEFRNRRKDGTEFVTEAHISSMVFAGRRYKVAVRMDITVRKLLEKQVLEISDREQARIGHDIHDGLCQQLIGAAFDANLLTQELAGKSRSEAARARRLGAVLDTAISEARRVSRGLYPVKLETDGLTSALHELAEAVCQRSHVRCTAEIPATVQIMDITVATHLYRIAQEAVANALKHAQPRHIRLRLDAAEDRITLQVSDDGVGMTAAGPDEAGMGLHIMNYRARAVGGTLQFRPHRRHGTVVSCCVPSPAR